MSLAKMKTESCWTNCFRFRWTTGPWSSCEPKDKATCGIGLQTRKVNCFMEDNGIDKKVQNLYCKELRRPLQETFSQFIIKALERLNQTSNEIIESILSDGKLNRFT